MLAELCGLAVSWHAVMCGVATTTQMLWELPWRRLLCLRVERLHLQQSPLPFTASDKSHCVQCGISHSLNDCVYLLYLQSLTCQDVNGTETCAAGTKLVNLTDSVTKDFQEECCAVSSRLGLMLWHSFPAVSKHSVGE